MPRLPKGKIGVYIYVDERLWDEFRRLAFMKHDAFHGVLSYELEQAIQAWLAQHTHKNTQILVPNKVNPQPKVYKVFNQVKEYLKQTYGYAAIVAGQQVPKVHLQSAIMAIRGADDRTVEKWMDRFLKAKLIKWVAGELYEIV